MEHIKTLVLSSEDLLEESNLKSVEELTIWDFSVTHQLRSEVPLVIYIADDGNTVVLKNRRGYTGIVHH